MFTKEEKTILVDALIAKKSATERARAKARHPEFAPVYDKVLSELAALTMKVQALQEVKNEGKASR